MKTLLIQSPKVPATIGGKDVLVYEALALEYSHDGACTGGELFSMSLSRDAARGVRDYTMSADFCAVFHNHLDRFYTLSLLLTGDHHKAERCFFASLEDCLQGNPVFREWTQSWATRIVIKNAIRIISPTAETPSCRENDGSPDDAPVSGPATAITNLRPFERLVYVLSVLEKYSDQECAVLLGSTADVIVRTRSQAMQHLVSVVTGEGAGELATAV